MIINPNNSVSSINLGSLKVYELPMEIIDSILSYLTLKECSIAARTNKNLKNHVFYHLRHRIYSLTSRHISLICSHITETQVTDKKILLDLATKIKVTTSFPILEETCKSIRDHLIDIFKQFKPEELHQLDATVPPETNLLSCRNIVSVAITCQSLTKALKLKGKDKSRALITVAMDFAKYNHFEKAMLLTKKLRYATTRNIGYLNVIWGLSQCRETEKALAIYNKLENLSDIPFYEKDQALHCLCLLLIEKGSPEAARVMKSISSPERKCAIILRTGMDLIKSGNLDLLKELFIDLRSLKKQPCLTFKEILKYAAIIKLLSQAYENMGAIGDALEVSIFFKNREEILADIYLSVSEDKLKEAYALCKSISDEDFSLKETAAFGIYQMLLQTNHPEACCAFAYAQEVRNATSELNQQKIKRPRLSP